MSLKLTIKPTASNVSAIYFFSNLSFLPFHKNLISTNAYSYFIRILATDLGQSGNKVPIT